MGTVGLVIAMAGLLAAVAPAGAEASAKIGTSITVGVSRADVSPSSGAIQVSGTLKRVSDMRLLSGAKVVLTARSVGSGNVVSTEGATTDGSGSYAMEINPRTSVNVSVAFLGSPLYDPSVSRSLRITASTPGGTASSSDGPQYVLVPLINTVCDGFKNTMGKFGGEGPTGDVVLGTFADQTAANCKGEKTSFFNSFVASLKEATGKLAVEKSFNINENRELVDGLVNLFSVSSPRVKLMPDSAKRVYDDFIQQVEIATGAAATACTRLSVPDAATCVQGVQAAVRRLAGLVV